MRGVFGVRKEVKRKSEKKKNKKNKKNIRVKKRKLVVNFEFSNGKNDLRLGTVCHMLRNISDLKICHFTPPMSIHTEFWIQQSSPS